MNRKALLFVLILLALAILAGFALAQVARPPVVWMAITTESGAGIVGYTDHYGDAPSRTDGAELWTDVPVGVVNALPDTYAVWIAPTQGRGPTGATIQYQVVSREPLADGGLRLWIRR